MEQKERTLNKYATFIAEASLAGKHPHLEK